MMLHSLCPFFLLLFLTGGDVALAKRSDTKGSDNTISCAYDTCCKAMEKLLTAFGELSENQDEQAVYISEKLGEQAVSMLEIKDKQAKDQEEVKVNLRDIHVKQEKVQKDLEELKANLNKILASTAAISTQLEKHSADLLRLDDRLKAHVATENNTLQCVQSLCAALPRDCSDIRQNGNSLSGVYRVSPGSGDKRREMDVYCDFSSVGQSWLVFQRRKDGSVDFERSWVDYANGFGSLTGEFWLGNDKLSLLTLNRRYKLRIEMEDLNGAKYWAEFSAFIVNGAADKYRLTALGITGTAGPGDSLAYNTGRVFGTLDSDNGLNLADCKPSASGGWWFNACLLGNLNARYDSITWYYVNLDYYSLKATEMKIALVQ